MLTSTLTEVVVTIPQGGVTGNFTGKVVWPSLKADHEVGLARLHHMPPIERRPWYAWPPLQPSHRRHRPYAPFHVTGSSIREPQLNS